MRLAESIRRSLARTDLRAAFTIAGLLLVVLAIQGLALQAYVAAESLEEAERWMRHALESVTLRADRDAALDPAIDDLRATLPGHIVAARVRDTQGRLVRTWGDWPDSRHRIETREHPGRYERLDVWLRRENQYLVSNASLADGRLLELALPLSHFARETAEIGRRLVVILLFSVCVALITGLIASLRAFAPLRGATLLLRGVDASNLGRRLPTRGTGDPVDLHAETLNRVLARIDTAFARLRAFSSDAAHELRTPLNRIGNVVDVALQGGDESELRAALETIRGTTDELSQMVQSLLLLAELGDRRLALPWPRLDVDDWIARTVEIYLPSYEERGVKLAARSEVGSIEGDRSLLDRVLVNLLDNALSHVESGGRVEISTLRTSEGIELRVDDSGPGIPSSERERVFERFARLDSGDLRMGHGLGLAIARAVMRMHGGDLSVEDSPLGGSRFCALLPTQPLRSSAEEQPMRG